MKKDQKKGLAMPAPEEVDVQKLQRAAYNPRVMPKDQMQALKASMRKHGMVLNLVVQKRGMTIIGGHQRLDALEQICAEDGAPVPKRVWATVLDVGDDEAKQLNVALNRISGEFDPYKLGELFESVYPKMLPSDFDAVGFKLEEVDELRGLVMPVDEAALALERAAAGDMAGFAKSVTLTVEFDTVEQRDQAKKRLAERAAARKKKAGAVLLELLSPASKDKAVAKPAKRANGARA